MDFSTIALSFLFGILFHILWTWTIGTGSGIIIMRRAINDCIIFMAKNLQNVYEIKHLKEEVLRMAGRDEKYIEWQARVDDREIDSLKKTCIRNFINSVPPMYNHLLKFHDWETAIEYINNTTKD